MNKKQNYYLSKARPKRKTKKVESGMNAARAQEVVESLPTPSIVAGINNLLQQLERRGIPVKDWDNRERALYRLQMQRGNLYFLAAETENED